MFIIIRAPVGVFHLASVLAGLAGVFIPTVAGGVRAATGQGIAMDIIVGTEEVREPDTGRGTERGNAMQIEMFTVTVRTELNKPGMLTKGVTKKI